MNSKKSLVHIGGSRPSEKATTAAQTLYAGLDQHDPKQVAAARTTYLELIPEENFGAEYTVLRWFCDYYLASESEKPKLLKTALDRDFLRFFPIEPETLRLLDPKLCSEQELIAFERLGDLLCVAFSKPSRRELVLQLRTVTKLEIAAFRAPWEDIQMALKDLG